jgi:hypothetical protein
MLPITELFAAKAKLAWKINSSINYYSEKLYEESNFDPDKRCEWCKQFFASPE